MVPADGRASEMLPTERRAETQVAGNAMDRDYGCLRDRQILYPRASRPRQAGVQSPAGSADTGGVLTRLGDRSGRRRLPVPLGLGLALGLALTLAQGARASEIEEEKGTLEQAREEAREAREFGEHFEVGLYPSADFYPGMHFGEFDATAYQPGGRLKVTMPVARHAAMRLIVRGSAMLTDFSDVSQN